MKRGHSASAAARSSSSHVALCSSPLPCVVPLLQTEETRIRTIRTRMTQADTAYERQAQEDARGGDGLPVASTNASASAARPPLHVCGSSANAASAAPCGPSSNGSIAIQPPALSVLLMEGATGGGNAPAAALSGPRSTTALPRSSTHGNLSWLLNQRRCADASNRRSSGAAAAVATTTATAATAAPALSSPARLRRPSVVGLRPEERVSCAAVLQWQRDTEARAQAQAQAVASPTAGPAAAAAAAADASCDGRMRSVSNSSSSSSRSGSPPIRYGVRTHTSPSLCSSTSLSDLSGWGAHGAVVESPESSRRSSHRLHVSTLLAHCANCGRLNRGEVLVVLEDGGLIHCSKECYWSSRLRRGNFDDHAEEEGDAPATADWEGESNDRDVGDADPARATPSPSPRARVIDNDPDEQRDAEEELDELDCKKRQLELDVDAPTTSGPEIPPPSAQANDAAAAHAPGSALSPLQAGATPAQMDQLITARCSHESQASC